MHVLTTTTTTTSSSSSSSSSSSGGGGGGGGGGSSGNINCSITLTYCFHTLSSEGCVNRVAGTVLLHTKCMFSKER